MFWKNKRKKGEAPENISDQSYRAVAHTDTGMVRKNNEDALRFIRPGSENTQSKKGYLAIVADGMGGHSSGEIASDLAIEIISDLYYKQDGNVLSALTNALEESNKKIYEEGKRNKLYEGMGTTCTVCVILQDQIYIAHIGDSRAYLLKHKQLIQLTQDHTLVHELLQKGEISPIEAESHPDRNIITKALGTKLKQQFDIFQSEFQFESDDKLMICSDGLYEYLKRDEMLQIIEENDLFEAAELLVETAKNRGGHDNISVLLIEIESEPVSTEKPTLFIS